MHRAVFSPVLALTSLLSLAACTHHIAPSTPATSAGQPTPAPTRQDAPPLATPGEQMLYRLSLQGVELASYELGIGEITEVAGKQAVPVYGHARSTGIAAFFAKIDDRFTSWVDITSGQPLRFQAEEYASGSKTKIERAVVDFAGRDGNAVAVQFQPSDEQTATEIQQVSGAVWDYNAFMLVLRSWEVPPGTTAGFEVFRSRYLWHVDVTMHGKEVFGTELGELPALRIDGRTHKLTRSGGRDPGSPERTFSLWISDDDARVPLEIRATTDYGDLRMRIIDYQPGTGRRLRP